MFNNCLICSDKNSFNSKLYSLNNINNSLFNIINIYEHKIKGELKYLEYAESKLMNEMSNVHMMCGVCPHVNTSSISNVDREVHEKVDVVCSLLKNDELSLDDKKNLYHEVLKLLSFYYPMSYKLVERFYYEEVLKK